MNLTYKKIIERAKTGNEHSLSRIDYLLHFYDCVTRFSDVSIAHYDGLYYVCVILDKHSSLNAKGDPKVIRAFRLLKIAMKRWRNRNTHSLKVKCRRVIEYHEIDFMSQYIPLDLKEYLLKV